MRIYTFLILLNFTATVFTLAIRSYILIYVFIIFIPVLIICIHIARSLCQWFSFALKNIIFIIMIIIYINWLQGLIVLLFFKIFIFILILLFWVCLIHKVKTTFLIKLLIYYIIFMIEIILLTWVILLVFKILLVIHLVQHFITLIILYKIPVWIRFSS